jgi:hypothetical protein
VLGTRKKGSYENDGKGQKLQHCILIYDKVYTPSLFILLNIASQQGAVAKTAKSRPF